MSANKNNDVDETTPRTMTTITGQVIDEKGYKIAGATVTCNGNVTTTLFDGSFEFNVLAPLTYNITVSQKGFTKQRRKITVTPDRETSIIFTLSPSTGSGSIFGYVYDSKNKCPIPTGGTAIMVLPVANRHVEINPESGEYQFRNLPPGKYQIFTSLFGYEDESKEITLTQNERKRVDFFCSKIKTLEVPWG